MSALRLDLEWRLTLFTLLLFPSLLALGFWQLERADEKMLLAARQQAQAAQPPVALAALPRSAGPEELAYLPLNVGGYFDPDAVIFRDNQLREGRYGLDVLGLFFDRESARWVLLNRGWVPADSARRSLPQIAIPDRDLALQTAVYVPPGDAYVLEAESFGDLSWPLLVQDTAAPALRDALEAHLGAQLFPFELRLADGEAAGFRRDWPVINVSPDKHRGYAVQWFTMAAALLVLFVMRSSNVMERD
jgi:surfeit locus 1 family protein